MHKIIIPRDIEIVISSFGGGGTSFLLDFVSKYKITNSPKDRDGFKHLPIPPISFNRNIKCVFVYSDPILATISLFRRKYHAIQATKLQRWQRIAYGDCITNNTTLEEYAIAGKDSFCFAQQFNNWHSRYLIHPTLFVKYESLFDNLEQLFHFIGIDKQEIINFPAKIDRKSNIQTISSKTYEQLKTIYKPLYEEFERTDDIEECAPCDNRLAKCFSPIYRRALYDHAENYTRKRFFKK